MPLPSLASSVFKGLQFRHLPFNTLPWSSMGTILNSFFRKHFWPHLTHSPRFLLSSSSSDRFITEPVVLKSVPTCSMLLSLLSYYRKLTVDRNFLLQKQRMESTDCPAQTVEACFGITRRESNKDPSTSNSLRHREVCIANY